MQKQVRRKDPGMSASQASCLSGGFRYGWPRTSNRELLSRGRHVKVCYDFILMLYDNQVRCLHVKKGNLQIGSFPLVSPSQVEGHPRNRHPCEVTFPPQTQTTYTHTKTQRHTCMSPRMTGHGFCSKVTAAGSVASS